MSDIYTIRLRSVGNPDLGQYAPLSTLMTANCGSLANIVSVCRDYIAANNLGAGNWPEPIVKKNGKPFCNVSYNGRCWDLDGKEIKVE